MKQIIRKFCFILFAVNFVLLNESCNKKDEIEPITIQTDSIIDVDGNIYKTVKIGNQWWMTENLTVTKYRDGVSINKIQGDTAQWRQDTLGAYCLFNDNSSSPGLLYNWFAVMNSKNIAPLGWHIPSDEEWKELERHLGMSMEDAEKINWRGGHEGEKLKIESPLGWTVFNDVWSTNESGFTALAGSCRLFNGIWGDPGLSSTGFWWTSTEVPDNMAWYRHLDYKNTNVFRYYGLKNYGFSIRCVKD